MSNQGTANPAGGRTADDAIQVFAGIELLVTDDAALIEKKISEQYPRKQREKNDRIATERALKAELWMQNANDLRNRRPDLLNLVYGKFVRQADASLHVALAQGVRTLTGALEDSLRSFLQDDCRVDTELAGKFLARYLSERGIKRDGAIVKPELVRNFAAVDVGGKVSLTWSLPPTKCEWVKIVRHSEVNAADEKELTVVDGAAFEDSRLQSGAWYTYRAYSVHQNVTSAGFAEARALVVGDVNDVQPPVCKDGRVRLSWASAGPASIGVLIFRRNGGGVVSVLNKGQVLEAGIETSLMYRGGGTTFDDKNIVEGATYAYKIIADFGDGRFGKGVDTQITIPKPPSAPSALKAVHKRSADENVVSLEWTPVTGVADVRYVVVKRDGEVAPASATQGTVVEETSQTRSIDRQVEPGHRYSYAVFARVGGLHSRNAATVPPVDILAEVNGIAVTTADGVVELQWTTPETAVDVVVKRSLNPPRSHDDNSTRVKLSGKGHARDEGLHNDRQYHYLVCCVYRPAGNAEVVSPGVRIEAVPSKLPGAPADFATNLRDREIRCTWTPPASGQVVVLRSAKVHGFQFGDRLSADELHALGERIPVSGLEAVDTAPTLNKPYYSVFAVAGSHAITGATSACVVCPDVTELSPQAIRDGIILRWRWPDNCTAVRIVRRLDSWPEGPNDPRAVGVPCTRVEFDSAGGRYVDKIRQSSGTFHYIVYAQVSGAPGQFFSAGNVDSCRARVLWDSAWTTIRYRIFPGENRSAPSPEIRLEWSVEEIAPGFSGFALLGNQDQVPSSLQDGVEFFRWSPAPGEKPGRHEASVSLDPLRARHWARMFVKVLVADPAQRFTTLIFHPNVCAQISESGQIQAESDTSPPPRVYAKGVPREAICPACFAEFPIAEMLFQSFRGGDLLRGRYTLWDRLTGKPPRPPVHQNERLTNKVCPKCKEGLPFTAGAQTSLVIGMVGAKYSGKSHFIGSLIERLSTQVGGDLQGALIAVSDETSDRYQREFYDPIFKSRLQLPFTSGTPKPLIYDLRFSGQLWGETEGRSVTLALYETAGENLVSEEKVKEMVQYLRPASGVIFLIDPLQIDAVRQNLPPTVALPPLDSQASPQDMIGRVLRNLEDGKVLERNEKLSTPVAVVLTKCDVLRDGKLIDLTRAWAGDRRHVGYFNRELHEDMSGLIEEYVKQWSPAVYNVVTQRFSRYAFFGASATGCAPDKTTGYYKYISPWRVEDPLLWLLAEVGVIPVR